MDIQRKKGVLDICVLAVLVRGASYGYKIVSDVSRCIEISAGWRGRGASPLTSRRTMAE